MKMKKEETGEENSRPLTRPELNWMIWFGFVSLAIHCAKAMLSTVYGPTQPYIARNLGTDPATISIQWTFSGSAWLAGSILSSAVFKSFIRSARMKLLYFTTCNSISACFFIASPFLKAVPVYFAFQFLGNFFAGCYAAVNIAMFVYNLGPIKSRPFTMLVHCLVGAGFLCGSFIVRPFLPSAKEGEERDFQAVCGAADANSTQYGSGGESIEDVVDIVGGLPSVYWPYIILGVSMMLSSWLFLPLALCTSERSFKMPVYEEQNEEERTEKADVREEYRKLAGWLPLIILIFLFYIVSCGIERIFQSTVFYYGLCGPLALEPKQASVSDNSYNGGFMIGRIVGTLIAGYVCPRNMLIISLTLCLSASIVLGLVATTSAIGLYAAAAMVGFAVSWQYGSAFSWTAQKIDVTGIIASLFAAACGVGGMSSVPLVSYLTEKEPTSMITAVVVMSVLHILIAVPMWFTGRFLKKREMEKEKRRKKAMEMSYVNEAHE